MSLYTDESNVEHIYIGQSQTRQHKYGFIYGIPPLSWMNVVMWQAVYNCLYVSLPVPKKRQNKRI